MTSLRDEINKLDHDISQFFQRFAMEIRDAMLAGNWKFVSDTLELIDTLLTPSLSEAYTKTPLCALFDFVNEVVNPLNRKSLDVEGYWIRCALVICAGRTLDSSCYRYVDIWKQLMLPCHVGLTKEELIEAVDKSGWRTLVKDIDWHFMCC